MNTDLIKSAAYVGGDWCAAADGAAFAVLNPADGAELARVPDMQEADARAAVAAANEAYPSWSQKSGQERGRLLRRWFELIHESREQLATLITREQGKPLAESRGEVIYGAAFVEWYAEEARRVYGEVIPAAVSDRRYLVIRQPVGVVAAITPWNFPLAMVTRKCAPALAAGCAVVLKPAEATPLTALALAELGAQAGLPAGVFNVITSSSGERVGKELTKNPLVRKLSFTGSTATGKALLEACASTVKNVSMELGGNAPFIVFDDADLEGAVAGAIASKYRNSGQTCICANRFLVQEGIYEAFSHRLADAVRKLIPGNGLDESVDQGPLINPAALAKVEAHVADATAQGAQVLCGGTRHELGGNFYKPTVLTEVSPKARINQEETFGPVAPLLRFATEQEAVELANSSDSGLAAYLYTRDVSRSWRVSEALEYGMVGVNESVISSELVPFGGMKESGLGREGGRQGIDEFVEQKYICIGLSNK